MHYWSVGMMLALLARWIDVCIIGRLELCLRYYYVGLMLALLVCWTDACITGMLD